MPLRFGPFSLDLEQRRLMRDATDVPLTPKCFDLLALLVVRRPAALSKDDIFRAVWKDTSVSENTLAAAIRDLRDALEDKAREPRFIRTAYGYAFIGNVVEDTRQQGRVQGQTEWRLILADGDVPLGPGEHILGRGGAGVIVIDSPTVSRHHARLTVRDRQMTCEDLGSKNGTWVGTTPVTTPVDVTDGAEIRLGSVVVTVRQYGDGSQSTETVEDRRR